MVEPTSPRIDVGRLVAIALFCLMLVGNAMSLFRDGGLGSPMGVVNTLLTMAFYFLLVWAYLRRTPSNRTDRHWWAWFVAVLGTAAPFSIPVVSGGTATGFRAEISAGVLMVGLVAMLWALGALGRNISVVPQAREVVSTGPYAFVRHPLYAAELFNVIGLCLGHRGLLPWVVLGLLVALQVTRARREERLLSRELLGYAAYRERTPMLLPTLTRGSVA